MPALGRLMRPAWLSVSSTQHTSTAAVLSPFFTHLQQCRQASILSSLSDNAGAYSKRIRRGRGPASGKGKTSGRGTKGQKAHGKVPAGFEGGQTPLSVVHGIRGFVNIHAQEMTPLNLSRLQRWISDGRLDPSKPISIHELQRSGCLTGIKDGVKLLAREALDMEFSTPIQIIVSRASASAIAAIEKAGGQVVTRYYSASSLARVMRGEVHPYYSLESRPLAPLATAHAVAAGDDADPGPAVVDETQLEASKTAAMQKYKYRLADPAGRKDIEYYRDAAHRGYLSYLVPEGQGPNLFFKGYGGLVKKGKTQRKGPAKADNMMW